MFVGHTALALAAKSRVPRSSLGMFNAATFGLDLLWPIFLLLGIEHARIDPGNTRFTPIALYDYPWSHSLVMAVVWGLVGAGVVRLSKGDGATQLMVGLLIVSHWVLDFVSHRPDMPLWPGESPLLGLGLWNSIPGTLLVEGALFLGGLFLYVRRTTPVDRVGSLAFWLLMGLSTVLWAGQPWMSPPPSERALAWFGLGSWLLPLWAGWADRHRVARNEARR